MSVDILLTVLPTVVVLRLLVTTVGRMAVPVAE
jgi:hypothetical protein